MHLELPMETGGPQAYGADGDLLLAAMHTFDYDINRHFVMSLTGEQCHERTFDSEFAILIYYEII